MDDERPGWHRHPNGGGWVQDTAHVDDTAYVGPDAGVSGSALVSGTAWVSGSAWVYGSARVSGTARVCGTAHVSGTARVSGTAQVEHPRHVLTVGPVGSEHRTVTAYRTEDGHEVAAGCWSGTVDELTARIADPAVAWPDAGAADRERWQADYEAVVALVRGRVTEWNENPAGRGREVE